MGLPLRVLNGVNRRSSVVPIWCLFVSIRGSILFACGERVRWANLRSLSLIAVFLRFCLKMNEKYDIMHTERIQETEIRMRQINRISG